VCEDSYPNAKAAVDTYGTANQLAYPHERIEDQMRRNEAENRRLAKAHDFLSRHPEFKEFLTLCIEGVLNVRG
jgi:hypothetical protein